ncbi:histone H2A, sperm-like [Melitaea cinxia]|uniref:histone H2A, sperm-like n=1 Tax=Melitaea cinxia TaxID=113334 RepID=UPI001E271F23|nr:histone H2A, sperm-like [Melitaea cinxia]
MPKKEATVKTKNQTRSIRSGLTLPVGRVHRILRKGNYAPRVGCEASVYLSAVLEYLCSEILELAGNAALENGRSRISPRHILLAIGNDVELDKMLTGVTISQGGVIPKIMPQLLPKKTAVKNYNITPNIAGSSQEY